MAVAFGGAGTYYAPGGSGGTTHAVPVPAGVTALDIVIVHFYIESSTAPTAPSGFAEIPAAPFTTGTVSGQRAFWKRATGADSGTYDFTNAATTFREACATRWTGCVTSGNPYDTGSGAPTSAQRSSAGTTTPAVSMTPAGDGRMIVWSGGTVGTGTSWTMPSGYSTGVNASKELGVGYLLQTSVAATGSLTGTSASGFQTAYLYALLPDVVTPSRFQIRNRARFRASLY